MKMKRTVFPAFLLGVALSAPAQAQDVNAMAKWTAATVVRYRVVGEYSGPATIVSGTKSKRTGTAQVTDRVEIDFDWDQTEMKIVGKPVIRNFPTTVVTLIAPPQCAAPRVEGPLEHATVLSMDDSSMERMSGTLTLRTTRAQPAGSVCMLEIDTLQQIWEAGPAKTENVDLKFTVAQAMALAMPGVIPTTPDKKSLVMKGGGWTWTQTPTIVR